MFILKNGRWVRNKSKKKKGYTMGIPEKRYTMAATPLMPFLAGACASAAAMGPSAGAHLPKLNFVEDMLF